MTTEISSARDLPIAPLTARTGEVARETRETKISVRVNLDGTGKAEVRTGLGFFDHMLTALSLHSRIDIALTCTGDLDVDDHHTIEDCALALGAAISDALGNRTGIARFADAFAPLDEALARCVIDLSGRPAPVVDLALTRESIGDVACENLVHFFESLAMTLKCALHVDVLRGRNDHHKAEAAFKATARALRAAVAPDSGAIPSTKGTLT